MTKAGKELSITPNQAIVAVGNQIDSIVNQCLPIAAQQSQNFVQALTLANGIKALRQIILHDKHIKETITSMQNTHLGFMTDRTDLAIWKSKQGSGKELKPYRYEDVAEVCIEAMLKGYRITNNEFNMIASRFYAAKNGKFRMIQECEGVTDFAFTTTSPQYEAKSQDGKQYAKVQCFASWRMDGTLVTLGSSESSEDRLMLKIVVNKYMGEDAIVGKALSKLFSRVLMRLDGKIMPEATDVIEDDNIVDAEFDEKTASDLSEAIQKKSKACSCGSCGECIKRGYTGQAGVEQEEEKPTTLKLSTPCPYCTANIKTVIVHMLEGGATTFVCPACKEEGKIEDGLPVAIPPVDAESLILCPYCQKDVKQTAIDMLDGGFITADCPYCHKQFRVEDGLPIGSYPPDDADRNKRGFDTWTDKDWLDWRDEWKNLRDAGLSTYFHKNRAAWDAAPIKLKEEGRVRWIKYYPETPWPLAPEVEEPEELSPEGEELKATNTEINKYPKPRVLEAMKNLELPDNRVLSLDESLMLLAECQKLTDGGGDLA